MYPVDLGCVGGVTLVDTVWLGVAVYGGNVLSVGVVY